MSKRAIFYAGAGVGFAGVLLAPKTSIGGLLLAVAGIVFVASARLRIAAEFADPAMDPRYVRAGDWGLVVVGVLFVVIGVGRLLSL